MHELKTGASERQRAYDNGNILQCRTEVPLLWQSHSSRPMLSHALILSAIPRVAPTSTGPRCSRTPISSSNLSLHLCRAVTPACAIKQKVVEIPEIRANILCGIVRVPVMP